MTCAKGLLASVLLLMPFLALAQDPPRAYIGVFACQQQPQTKRSATLVSKTGAQAYIEANVRVVASRRDESSGEPSHKCRVDWTLHVAASGQTTFEAVPVHSYTEKEFNVGFSTDASTYYGGS
ncbi:MAG TPA: hypothetical protein VD837_01855, partial [Terriglobales bacterium]|nr:hypothetical protein [Terriglobales bacterium]